jgi:hypothetical protein
MSPHGVIILGAIITGALYVWRYFTLGFAENVNIISPKGFAHALGLTGGGLVSPEGFLVAWGVTWLGVSVLAGIYAPLGAALAVLIIVGDVLLNAVAVGNKAATLEEAKLIKEHAARGEAERAPGLYVKPKAKGK